MKKRCTRCGEQKVLELFCKGHNYPGGYRNVCKDCHRVAEAARRHRDTAEYNRKERERYATSDKKALSNKAWNERNSDKVKEYEKRRGPERSLYKKRYCKEYYIRHMSKAKAAAAEQRRKNPEYCKTQVKLWRNPGKHKVHLVRRRTRKMNAGAVSAEALTHVFQATCCAYCEVPFEPEGSRSLQVEHILPLARGGTNHKSNFAAACQFCNCSKHDKILYYEWLPPGLTREQYFTPEEVEAYRVGEVARQRSALGL